MWLAPLDGGRAWRVSADQAGAGSPRFSPDGSLLAWTSWRDVEPEVHLAPVDGGPSTRLTFWGDVNTEVLGWSADGDVVLAGSTAGQHSIRHTWVHAVSADGSGSRRLPYGPAGGVAFGPDGAVLLLGAYTRDPAWWKRYRGGTAGKLWLDADGDGEFVRFLADLDSNLSSPMWVGDRIAFLSDHEGVADLYSCAPDGGDLRRHRVDAPGGFYARNATTDGERVIFHRAGRLWLVDGLDAGAEPRELDVRLGGPRAARAPYPVHASGELGDVGPDGSGRASAVEVRGTVHWLTHRDGPVRALSAEPGVRARLPRTLGEQVVWVTDADGEDALEIAPLDGLAAGSTPRRIGSGRLGRVLELATAADGRRIAVDHPRRPGAAGRRRHRRAARGRPQRRRRPDRPGVLARLGMARLVAPGPDPVAAHQDGQHHRPGRRRRHADPLRRPRPGVHSGRQAPGVPVPARLRPGLRRARVRPVLRQRVPAAPAAAGRDHALAVLPAAARPAGRGGRRQGQARRPRRPRRGPRRRRRRPAAHRGRPGGPGRPGGAGAGARGAVLGAARGEGRSGVAARPAVRRARRGRRRRGRGRPPLGARAVRLHQAQARGALRGRRRRVGSPATASGWSCGTAGACGCRRPTASPTATPTAPTT